MATDAAYSRIHRWLPAIAGIVLIAAVFLVDIVAEGTASFHYLRIAFVVLGSALAVLGFFSRQRQFGGVLAKVSLAILSMVFALAAAEIIFRIISFDFGRFNQPDDDIPIYYRPPTVHAGDGVFRRPGPTSWQGQALRAYMRMHGTNDARYADEPPVLIQYDALGFRNPLDLTDWDVVVTGDSFVELGFLPYEELFTTLAGKRLGLRIKNLGVSGTGPISQTWYVNNYGKAPSTTDAVLCFFEGNDVQDLMLELQKAESFRTTRDPWAGRKQVSLLKALHARLGQAQPQQPIVANAALMSTVPPRPMTVYWAPAWEQIRPNRKEALLQALANWAQMVRAKGMRPWVMYLPDNHRVFHGMIRYANSMRAHLQPLDFGAHLGAACTDLGIRFIDTFPALRREAEAGRVPYNLLGDTHLSSEGSRIVGDILADALKSVRGR